MTFNDKIIWRIVPLAFFASWFTYKLYKSSQNDFFLDGFVFLFIGVVGILFFIWTIRKDFKEHKETRSLSSYIPTCIGLLFILMICGLSFYQDNKTNSPTLIRAFYDGGYNGFSIDLKKNGSYVMANGSGLGQDYFYGNYTITDSIVTLDKSNIDNCIKTNKLVIRTEQYYLQSDTNSNELKANYITQVDNNGNEIDKNFRLRVIDDNRK